MTQQYFDRIQQENSAAVVRGIGLQAMGLCALLNGLGLLFLGPISGFAVGFVLAGIAWLVNYVAAQISWAKGDVSGWLIVAGIALVSVSFCAFATSAWLNPLN